MHLANLMFLHRVAVLFGQFFIDRDVLEIGSNIEAETANRKDKVWNPGAVRGIFQHGTRSYTGIDLVAGKGVDIVGDAVGYNFDGRKFDAILNISVMEHEPLWALLFENTWKALKPGGVYVITCGCENNLKHLPEPWALVPSWDLLLAIRRNAPDSFVVHAGFDEFMTPMTDTPGVFNLVLRKGVPGQSTSGV